jgi:cell shape-determining protein MreD
VEFDALLTVAEIGATFAGLSALAGLIRPGRRAGTQVEGIVLTSLAVVAFAIIPILFIKARMEPGFALRSSAAIASVIWTAVWVRAALETRRAFKDDSEARPDFAFMVVVFINNVTGSLLAVAVSFALFPAFDEVLYLGVVLCPLFTASALLFNVVRLVSGLRGDSPAAQHLSGPVRQ